MKCLILAAGYATRLYPLTKNYPKSLLKINNKTIIDWLLDDLDKTNRINEYIIVTNHKFIHYFEKWKQSIHHSSIITIIDDETECNEERLGALGDILFAIKKLNLKEELLVMAGDNILDFSLNSFIDYYDKKKATCVMRYIENKQENILKSSCLKVLDNDLVIDMVEKPLVPISNWCCPPFYIYCLNDVINFEKALENGCNKDYLGSYIEYIYKIKNVYAMIMPGKRYDIGTAESYYSVCNLFNK